jgi:hypothetical protein
MVDAACAARSRSSTSSHRRRNSRTCSDEKSATWVFYHVACTSAKCQSARQISRRIERTGARARQIDGARNPGTILAVRWQAFLFEMGALLALACGTDTPTGGDDDDDAGGGATGGTSPSGGAAGSGLSASGGASGHRPVELQRPGDPAVAGRLGRLSVEAPVRALLVAPAVAPAPADQGRAARENGAATRATSSARVTR